MKTTKRILGILLSCIMLMGMLSVGVFAAEGTQENPINANNKWFGYGVDTYLLNPTLDAGNEDGIWYQLTADQGGILFLEHKIKDVDYTVTISVNGVTYEGGANNGELCNAPLMTYPVQAGDVATIHFTTKDAAAGTIYANMNVIAGDADNAVRVKSADIDVYVGAGQTVYFQDDTLNAIYATKGLMIIGDKVADTTFYTVSKNVESGALVKKAFVDSDEDDIIEATLGGNLGSAGAPPVKPAWAIENTSDTDCCYSLYLVDAVHECVYDDVFDEDCNSCGDTRLIQISKFFNAAGSSISEDVSGLAFRYDVKADGMKADESVAIYDDATISGMKLIGMGAVVSNTDRLTRPTLEDVNDFDVVNIPAVYLCDLYGDAEDTVSFAARIVNIPDHGKDTPLWFHGYVILEDAAGNQKVYYDMGSAAAYNWF